MGVNVSETTAETRMVTLNVTANSRKRRPTMSPMNNSGISTAISEMVSDMMVNPICSDPRNAAFIGASPSSIYRAMFSIITMASSTTKPVDDIPRNVLDHHDGVVHHKAGGDRQRHQSQVVQAVAQQIHHA